MNESATPHPTPARDAHVTVLGSQLERAARLAEVMTAAEAETNPDIRDDPWTVQDVINVALARSLAAMEETYLKAATS
jgi:hypothetical protein